MILDVMVPDDMTIQIEAQRQSSTDLYAGQVVFASDPFNIHGYRRCQGLPDNLRNLFFESKDALYILAGRRAPKHVSLPALVALQQSMGAPYRD